MQLPNKTNIHPHSGTPLPPVILLLGPTATGKTALAMEFVQHVPAEIISVDSAMVYRGMDIGTGKPTIEELKAAPHHLIDILDPTEAYSAAEFCHAALKLIQEIQSRGRIPLLVGGTMLYFRSLLQGLSPLPSADQNLRKRLLWEGDNLGWQAMHDRLSCLDPKAAARIHPNDPQRIQRALEIYELTGKTQSACWEANAGSEFSNLENKLTKSIFDVLRGNGGGALHIFVVLPNNRSLLHKQIQTRFQRMLQQGFINEVENLYQELQTRQFSLTLPALRAVGYRQILQYLTGECSQEEMVERALAATRQLAKRQITWLRGLFKIPGLIHLQHSDELALSPEYANLDQAQITRIHLLDIEKNHLDSLKSMIHCIA